MKTERSDIEFPVWRKKVDASLFKDAVTPIPKWLWEIWQIEKLFSKSTSKKSKECSVSIIFNKQKFVGRVILSSNKKMYRLFFDKALGDALKDIYLMSYMRSIEQDLRKGKPEYEGQDIENEIPFWEFLDIEFDTDSKIFHFRSFYTQKPAYTELFKELVRSHVIKIIDDTLHAKEEFRFTKQDWKHRNELKGCIDAKNVLYTLIDTKNKLLYIGEAESLIQRLSQKRLSIIDWDYFRYDCLPTGLTKKQRIAIERLMIRAFASFFKNNKGILSQEVSDYILVNEKIDLS